MRMNEKFFNTDEILRMLALEPLSDSRYLGQSHFLGTPRIFGGQLIGQSIFAASATMKSASRLQSMQVMFLQAGNYRLPVLFEVESLIEDSERSVTAVTAFQGSQRLTTAVASFSSAMQITRPARPDFRPRIPDPFALPSSVPQWLKTTRAGGHGLTGVPVDFRTEHGADLHGGLTDAPGKQMWIRSPTVLDCRQTMHDALLGYVSDFSLLATTLKPHRLSLSDRRLQMASISHSIWLHGTARMDEWHLIDMESPNGSGGRGMACARLYNRQGALIATIVQEGLLRLRHV